MELRRWSHEGRLEWVWHSATCLAAVLAVTATTGCRAPWQTPHSEPSFDRLIEIEQNSASRSTGREPLASGRRPGQAPYPTAQSLAEEGDAAALEDMLAEVPAPQRELLRREMRNLQSRSDSRNEPLAMAAHGERPRSEVDAPSRDRGISYQLSDLDDEEESPHAGQRIAASDAPARKAETPRPSRPVVKPNAVEEHYVGRVSDGAEEDAAVVALAENSPTAGPVVSASYSPNSSPTASPSSAASEPHLEWRQHIYQAIAQLEAESPAGSPEEQVHLEMVERLLQLAVGDLNASMEPIDGLQTHGQDFVRHSLESLYEVTNPQGNPIEIKRYSLAMLSQRKAMSHLAAVSNLEVRNAAFCTEVDGFGVVSKFPKYNFRADQELLLYCELDNFVSTPVDGKGYETQLQGSYEIVDEGGRRIADQLLPMDSHLCRNERRDYYIAYRIYTPQNIEPGRYQLKLIVEDMKGRKFGQSTLDFRITQ
ncbi:MAG: hypothetical protein KDA45_04190 [Planctomycetales bacterium]|nr:hypothetical protein [Planctomycetales bacterium]